MLKKRNKLSEINITPLVDVMLVLLVIFMVVSSSMYNDTRVRVPTIKYVKDETALTKKDMVKVVISSSEVLINDKKVTEETFTQECRDLNRELVVCVRADKDLSYQKVFAVLNKLSALGFYNFALVGVVA